EIHMGRSVAVEAGAPLFSLQERNGLPCEERDGRISSSGQVWGCYLHGLFENDRFRTALLNHLRAKKGEPLGSPSSNYLAMKEAAFDRLEAALRESLDWKRLDDLL
ncbi:MAG TPA: hypothetical protein VIK48_02750, partial [Candidatus Manganitrophaceae bacterium]